MYFYWHRSSPQYELQEAFTGFSVTNFHETWWKCWSLGPPPVCQAWLRTTNRSNFGRDTGKNKQVHMSSTKLCMAKDAEVCLLLSWPWKEATADKQSADPTQILTTSAAVNSSWSFSKSQTTKTNMHLFFPWDWFSIKCQIRLLIIFASS